MKRVFITGASSGIGRALALAYAKKGGPLGLAARRLDILREIAEESSSIGGTPFIYQLDVQDAKKCKSVAEQYMIDSGGIDIAIANAGIGGDDDLFSGNTKKINTILNTNLLGVTNILFPFLPTMKNQKSGVIVCISSVASFTPLPYHGGYTGSKIAIRMLFDSWRPRLDKYNIKSVSSCPGVIDTPIVKGSARRFPMKSAYEAATQFVDVIDRRHSTYVYPWPYKILILIIRLTPERFYNWLIKKIFSKPIN